MNLNKKLIILIGPSGSGKTTWAKKFMKTNSNYVRVNRDEIRKQLFGIDSIYEYNYTEKEKEKLVTKIHYETIRNLFKEQFNVIDDNTNCSIEFLKNLIKEFNLLVDIELVFMPIESNEQIYKDRVAKRDNVDVSKLNYINKQYANLVLVYKCYSNKTIIPKIHVEKITNKSYLLPNAYICDIDGTIAEKGDRNIFDYSNVLNDIPIQPVTKIINYLLEHDNTIIFVSGRSEICKLQTEKWLQKHINNYDPSKVHLFMRKMGDDRRDSVIKLEIFENHIKGKYEIEAVFEDRLQVMEECWNRLNLFTINVNQGNVRF